MPDAIKDAAIGNKKIQKLSQIAASLIPASKFLEIFNLPASITMLRFATKRQPESTWTVLYSGILPLVDSNSWEGAEIHKVVRQPEVAAVGKIEVASLP